MKNLLLMIAAILLSAGVFAQTTETKTTVTKTTETKTAKKAMKYCCPKCDYTSSGVGTCPHHKVALVKGETEVKYCCGKCDWSIPPVKGKCAHSTASVYKDGTLNCVYCHDNAGKCTKCGMEMEKIEIKKQKTKKG